MWCDTLRFTTLQNRQDEKNAREIVTLMTSFHSLPQNRSNHLYGCKFILYIYISIRYFSALQSTVSIPTLEAAVSSYNEMISVPHNARFEELYDAI